MPFFGAHVSISGGVLNSPLRGRDAGCDVIQIFTKSSNQWKARELSDAEISEFHKNSDLTGIRVAVAHNSYLINLASPDETTYTRSMAAMRVEMERASSLRIPFLVIHPGAHVGSGEDKGIGKIIASLNELFSSMRGETPSILIETTAGQGSVLGYSFEQIAAIIEKVKDNCKIGVCFDTCHSYVAGYDLRSRYDEVFDHFDRVIGISRIKAFHLNDTRKGLGSRVDRHWHIGKGELGLDTFRRIVRDERFREIPMIIETPKGVDEKGLDLDIANLRILRGLSHS